MNRIPRDKLIPNEKIKKGKRIGNGQFGEVYKGKAIVYGFFMVKHLTTIFQTLCNNTYGCMLVIMQEHISAPKGKKKLQ